MINLRARDIADGLDPEEMRQEEEARAMADLEDLLCMPVGTVSHGRMRTPGWAHLLRHQ